MFCKNCGKEIDDNAAICVGCGVATKNNSDGEQSWVTALLLVLFFGGFGAHRFYTGHNISGTLQLLLSITGIGLIISAPWAFFDFISILSGGFKTKKGEQLRK